MQNVAMEMNLAETAFLVSTDDADSFHLRWFTPATEVDLCGHATLAAAHTLIEQARVEAGQPIRFQTRSGELTCTQSGSRITLDFPATPPSDDVDPKVAEQALQCVGDSRSDRFAKQVRPAGDCRRCEHRRIASAEFQRTRGHRHTRRHGDGRWRSERHRLRFPLLLAPMRDQ